MSFVPKTPRRLQAHTHRGAANCPPIPAFLPYPHLIPIRRIPIPIPTTAPPIPAFLPYPHLIPIRRIPQPLRGSAARVVTSRFGRLTIIQLLNQTEPNQRTNQLRNKPNTRPNVPVSLSIRRSTRFIFTRAAQTRRPLITSCSSFLLRCRRVPQSVASISENFLGRLLLASLFLSLSARPSERCVDF